MYEDELAPVLRIAEQEGIPVVSPLATIDHTHSDVLFQMAPDPARKYAKLARPLNSGRRVVLIYSQHTDTAFEQAVKALEAGAFALVVGGAITRPAEITARFTGAINAMNK